MVCVEVIEGELDRDVEFRLQTSDSSTTGIACLLVGVLCSKVTFLHAAGEDYESVDLTLSISGDTVCIDIAILCDETFEIPDQSFLVLLTTDDAVVMAAPDQVEIVIEDKDQGTRLLCGHLACLIIVSFLLYAVSLTPSFPTEVCENSMEVLVCVTNSLEIPVEGELTVRIETTERTASGW